MSTMPFWAKRSMIEVRVAHRLAAAVEARVHPAHVVGDEDEDVGLIAEALLQVGQLGPRLLLLVRVGDTGSMLGTTSPPERFAGGHKSACELTVYVRRH